VADDICGEGKGVMQRIFYLNSQPLLLAQQIAVQKDFEIITPAQLAAKALGVPKRSLSDIAQKIVQKQGIQAAPALIAQQTLHSVISQTTADAEGMTRSVFPTIRALLRATPTLEHLDLSSSPRVRQWVQYARSYRDELRQKKYIDSSELLWRATELEPTRRKILVYGYFCPQWDELEFLNAIADDGSIFFLPLPDHSLFTENKAAVEWLQQQGWQVKDMPSEPETVGQVLAANFLGNTTKLEIYAFQYPHLEAEVRGVLAQVKQLLLEGVAAKEIVLVTRNETTYGGLLLDVAAEYQVTLRALYDVPLTSTRMGTWLGLLVDVIRSEFLFEDTAKLLSHPLCTNPSQESWAKARRSRPIGFASWQQFAADTLEIDLSILQFPEAMRRDEWVERWQIILRQFDLRRRSARWAKEAIAFDRFYEALKQLSLPEAEVLSWEAFAQLLKACLSVLTVPAQPGRGGVELHSPASVLGAQYRYLFVLGMAEGILPTPIKDDPVLDFYERKQLPELRLESAAEMARREAVTFYLLLQTISEQVSFSYSGLHGKEVWLPSPYLKRLGLSIVEAAEMPLASLQEARRTYVRQDSESLEDEVLPRAIAAFTIESNRESDRPADEYDGVVGIALDPAEREFSVSQLTQLGQCPFKWFAHKVLKLKGVEEAETELSPGLRGNLYHKILELALQTSDDPTIEQLESTFLEAEQALNFPDIPAWQAQRLEHLQLLHRTLNQDTFLAAGAEVAALETWFEGMWHGLKIRGRVDRIDRTEQGLVLMDYKTSSTAPHGVKDEQGKAHIDIQLSLYRDVAAPALFPDEAIAEVLYYSVPKGKKISSKKSPPTTEDLEPFATRCKTHLTTGNYPVQPDVEAIACKYCEYDVVCRQGSRLSRKGGAEA
jgi:hypothetical protein